MKKILSIIFSVLFVGGLSAGAYTIMPGDTLSQIAQDNDTTVEELVDLNALEDENKIYAGQNLMLPFEIDDLIGGAPFRPSGIDIAIREDLVAGASRSGNTLDVNPIIGFDGTRWTMAVSGDILFGKLSEGTNQEEIISWTGMTDNTTYYTLTGVEWGYLSNSLATSTANMKRHNSGASLIITNDDHYLNRQFVNVRTDQSILAKKTYNVYPEALSTLGTPTTTWQLAPKIYVDNVLNQGAATSTELVAGISGLATRLEQASSTWNGILDPLVLQSRYSSDNTRGFVLGQNQVATTTDQIASSTSNFFAQTFQTSATTTRINAIDVSLKKVGTPTGTFNVGIYLTDTNGVPTTNLQSASLDISTLGTEYEIKRFDIGNAAKVSPNTTYAIVLDPLSATITDANYVNWAYNDSDSGDLYTNGSYYASTTATTWTASTTADFYFQVYGNEPATDNTTIISDSGGKLDWSWIDLTRNVKPTGLWLFAGTTTFTGPMVGGSIATISLNAGETIDGTTDPVPVYIKASDGELYKADATISDDRDANVMGVVTNSTSDGVAATLVDSQITSMSSQATSTTVSEYVDQQQLNNTGTHTNFTTNQIYDAINFKVGDKTGNISKIDLVFQKAASPTGNFVLDIYAVDSDGKPTGSILGTSATRDISAFVTSPGQVESFTFSTPVDVTPGQELSIVVNSSGATLDATNKILIRGVAGANKLYNYLNSPTNVLHESTDGGSTWNASDHATYFKTYSTQNEYMYGDNIWLSETAGAFSLDYPTSGVPLVKVGEFLSQTLIKVDSTKKGTFLGSIVGDTDTSATQTYGVPPGTYEVVVDMKDDDTRDSQGQVTLRKNEILTGTILVDDGAATNSLVATWTNGVISITVDTDDDSTVYFYSY